jgi:hypothetical protein
VLWKEKKNEKEREGEERWGVPRYNSKQNRRKEKEETKKLASKDPEGGGGGVWYIKCKLLLYIKRPTAWRFFFFIIIILPFLDTRLLLGSPFPSPRTHVAVAKEAAAITPQKKPET